MDTLRHGYVSIKRGLEGPLDIVDVPVMQQRSGLCGYVRVYQVEGRVHHRGAIHINFSDITEQNTDKVAKTLIHEAAHKFIAANDYAYEWEISKWRNMTRHQALNNADSLAWFAMNAATRSLY
jgi:uncharacterized protein (DUF885 family)